VSGLSIAFHVSYVVLWLVVVFDTFLIFELVRRSAHAGDRHDEAGELLPKLEVEDHLPYGTPAADFEARQISDGAVVRPREWRGRVLLAFVRPGCAKCEAAFPTMSVVAEQSDARLVLLCSGPRRMCKVFLESVGAPDVDALYDETGSVSTLFAIKDTPKLVLLDEDWTVVKYGVPGPIPEEFLLLQAFSTAPLGGQARTHGDDRP
jgi:hypothetical protein